MPAYADATLDAIEPFADEQFDLVIYGCTAAGFLGGPAGNARMVEKLRERTGATVVSTAGAMVDALRHDGVDEHRGGDALSAAGERRPARLSRNPRALPSKP